MSLSWLIWVNGLALIGLTCWNIWGWTSTLSYSSTTTLTPWWSGSLTILDYCEGLMICHPQIMCVSVYTRRKSLSYSLPRRRAASPRILIQHASPEDDRYPSVEPPQLRPRRAWLMPSNLIPSWSISKKDPKGFEGLTLKESGVSHWSSNDELVSNWVNGWRQMSNSSCL